MKNLVSLLIVLSFSLSIHAQTTTDNSLTVEQYVNDILLGEGVDAFNVTYNGFDANQVQPRVGSFDATASDFPFDGGMIMTTKNVNIATCGPGGDGSGGGTDSDLSQIVTGGLNDVTVVEFDFIPEGDSVKFNFIFASTEYNTFVCSQYNDVFGFFISGPGINGTFSGGAENLAVLPTDGVTPIAINTINNGNPVGSPCNYDGLNCPCNSEFFINNGGGTGSAIDSDVCFGGYTVPLTARAQVQCGQQYHMKLAIANVVDGALDSGVFLEEGSFTSEATVDIDANPVNNGIQVGGNDFTDGVLAGCTNAEFCLSRDDTVGIDTSYFSIVGSAIPGVQYVLPEEEYVIFPEGEDTICFEIETLANDLGAQVDSIEFAVFFIDNCSGDSVFATASIAVYNEYSFDIATEDVTITCPTELVELEAAASNGISPYSYSWALESDPDTEIGQGSSIAVEPPGSGLSQTYIITVDDDCGITTETTTVTLFDETVPDPQVTITPDNASINCVGQTVDLTAFGTNGQGDLEYAWTTGDDTPTITVAPGSTPPTTYYTVFVTDECGVTASDSVGVDFIPLENPVANAGDDIELLCAGDEALIEASASGGAPPYQYTWLSLPAGDTQVVSPEVTTTYYLTVTDDCQGESEMDSITVVVPVYDPVEVNVPDITSVCPGDEQVLAANVSGGTGVYTFEWDESGSNSSSIVVSPMSSSQYSVTATDQCGSVGTETAIVTIPFYDNIAITPTSKPVCTGESFSLSIADISGGAGETASDYSYTWTDASGTPLEGVSENGSITLSDLTDADTLFTVVAVDQCGNIGNADVVARRFGVDMIPNIITPGVSPGSNDEFIIPGSSVFDTEVTILNRWGKVVFESSDYVCDRQPDSDPSTLIDSNCWQGDDVQAGVYYYILNIDNGNCTFQGTLHINDTQ